MPARGIHPPSCCASDATPAMPHYVYSERCEKCLPARRLTQCVPSMISDSRRHARARKCTPVARGRATALACPRAAPASSSSTQKMPTARARWRARESGPPGVRWVGGRAKVDRLNVETLGAAIFHVSRGQVSMIHQVQKSGRRTDAGCPCEQRSGCSSRSESCAASCARSGDDAAGPSCAQTSWCSP